MPRVFISIGSNINRETNIKAGVRALRDRYGAVDVSPVYESVSVGFDGDNFLNLVAAFDTTDSIDMVCQFLSQVEDANGRDRSGPRFSSRTLDMDLLLYDDATIKKGKLELPRPEIYKNAFVLKPLADIAADVNDPVKKISYAQLWREFSDSNQSLWQVDMDFNS